MRCPKCDMLLLNEDRLDIEIDICPSCKGVWLDRGELNDILVRSAGLPLPPLAADEAEALAPVPASGPDPDPPGRRAEQSYWMTVLNAD